MTEENRKLQIPVVVDSTGAKDGFGEVKTAARDMAQAVQQAGQQASKGVDGIGQGAPATSQKVESATRSMIASIQRTTAAMEAGSRTSTKYYEVIAAQRGVSMEALKPYLAQLDAVAAKQTQATGAVNSGSASLNSMGMSAKATAAALRQVPAQFTDIITSLQGGQRPMTVLLQQGGQLKDVFGGIGPAARAMGGYILGLVSPATVAAAALGGLAIAYMQGAREARAFDNALTSSGNVIGLTASQYGQLRDSLTDVADTKAKASEALTEIAKAGTFTRESVKGIAEAAILMEKATGQSIGTTINQFKELARSPAEASAKLNEQYNYLTASIYKQIKALEDQGRATDAANLAEKTYADAIATRGKQIVENVGYIEAKFRSLWVYAKKGWDAVFDVGRPETGSEQLDRLRQTLASRIASGPLNATTSAAFERGNEKLRQQIAILERLTGLQEKQTAAQAEKNRLEQLGIDFAKRGEEFKTRAAKRDEEIERARIQGQQLVNAGLITERELTERLLLIRQKYSDTTGQSEVAGIIARTKEQQQYLAKQREQMGSGLFGESIKPTEGEKLVLKIQEELKTGILGVARAEKERALAAAQSQAVVDKQVESMERQIKAYQDTREATEKQVVAAGQQADAIRQQALEQEGAAATFGKSKTAIEEVVLAQLRLQAAEADATDHFDPRYVAGLQAKVRAQEDYVAALRKLENRKLEAKLNEGGRVSAEEAATLQLELSLLGQSREMRERILGQRQAELKLAQEIAEIDRSGASDDDKERRRAQARANYQIDAANAATKATLSEWQRTADSINQSLTDALMRGFEAGKSFAENLRDTLRNMFQTLILRPVISAVLSPISGTLAGIGQQIGQSIIGGGGSGMFGSIGQSVVTSQIGQQLGLPSLSSALGFGGASVGANTALVAGLTGDAAAAAAASSAAGAAGSGLAGLSAIPGWGWALGGAALLAGSGLFGKRGGPKADGRAGTGLQTDIGTFDNSLAGNLSPIVDRLNAEYDAVAKALGGVAGAARFGLAVSTDPKGTAPSFVEAAASLNGQSVYSKLNRDVGRSDEEMQAAINLQTKTALLEALKASDLSGQLANWLRSVDVASDAEGIYARVLKASAERATLEERLFQATASELEKLNRARQAERDAIDETNRALLEQVYAQEDLAKAGAALVDAFQREQGALKGYARSLRDFVASAMLGGGSPLGATARTAQAGQQFETLLAQAHAGDAEARSRLAGASGDYLTAAMGSARTRAEYDQIFARVTGALTLEAASAESQATLQEKDFEVQKAQLITLGLLNENVQTFAQAMANYLNAQTTFEQAKQAAQAANGSYVAPLPTQPAAVDPWDEYLATLSGQALADARMRRSLGWSLAAVKAYGSWASMDDIAYRFAAGGSHNGGLRLVGEEGPELEVTGPSRIYSASQTRDLLKGLNGGSEMAEAMRALRDEVKAARLEARTGDAASVGILTKLSSLMNKWDRQGTPKVREEVVA